MRRPAVIALAVGLAALSGCGGVSAHSSKSTPRIGPDDGITRETVATVPGEDGDQQILDQLTRGGAHLSQPRIVNHHIYFDDQIEAIGFASTLKQAGYDTVTEQTDQGDWLITATVREVVNLRSIKADQAKIQRLLDGTPGTYDGWEAAMKP